MQNTSGLGEHIGEALAGFGWVENASSGKIFSECVLLSNGDYPEGGNTLHYSTFPANYMHQQISPQPLIPVLLPLKGHQELEDEDFALWLKNLWSRYFYKLMMIFLGFLLVPIPT